MAYGQLGKIPEDAKLIAEFTKENVGLVRVFQGYKSHGYQTDYKRIPVWLFAVAGPADQVGRRSWRVHEKRERTGEAAFWKIIRACESHGYTRIK